VDFLLVLIELLLGVTAKSLLAKIGRKSAFCKRVGQYLPNFHAEGDVPTYHFLTDSYSNECRTTLSLTVFTQKKFVADILQAMCDFRRKTAVFRF